MYTNHIHTTATPTQGLPVLAVPATVSPVYLNDGQSVDTTGYLLDLTRRILKGDHVGQATESTFEQVCKDGIKKRLRENRGKIIVGVGLLLAASATVGYQMKKHDVLNF